MNVQYFPFDTQLCVMTFASWTNDIETMNYTTNSDKVYTGDYSADEEWELLSFDWEREEVSRSSFT